MSVLHLAENIAGMRRRKGITQEELAQFIGVTKASVSKWENGQSAPDILLLPQLAVFFDVTVDELLGYEPQLGREQIRHCYQRLAKAFACQEFEEVMAESERLVKKYYSCHAFLAQVCVLWLNHFMMAGTKERQTDILLKIEKLCCHILESCNDLVTCNYAVEIRAVVNLQLGRLDEVIEALEEVCKSDSYSQKEHSLVSAYMMKGETEKADKAAQIYLYRNVMGCLSDSIQLLAVHMNDMPKCGEILKRADALIEAFGLQEMNPNLVANYEFQAALVMCCHEEEKAYQRLAKYADAIRLLFERHISFCGDGLFDRIGEWFEECELSNEFVRDPKLIAESALSVFAHPSIAGLKNQGQVEQIRRRVEEACTIK